jgi:hypothetical protein
MGERAAAVGSGLTVASLSLLIVTSSGSRHILSHIHMSARLEFVGCAIAAAGHPREFTRLLLEGATYGSPMVTRAAKIRYSSAGRLCDRAGSGDWMGGGERGGVLMALLTRRRPDAPEGFAEARLDRCQASGGLRPG